ncbi:MAG: hypothetical protein R3266_15890, partial [Gemmatimonadota bacterium]|nr:hypothetical protein [Gemmatimonadota bacterium]
MSVAVVAGALANKPGNGGEAWVRMSWARGLARLGFDVWFIESISDPGGSPAELERSAPVRFFRDVTEANGFAGRRALRAGDRLLHVSPAEWEDLADACGLLVNISGHWRPDPWFERIPVKVYVDLDPGYTQIWAERGLLGDQLERHDAHYTVGLAVGTSACDLPVDGVDWRPILQPVVLD